MSGNRLVLVTGVNGFIAARTVEAFLKAGYAVRGTTRSRSSANGLLESLPEYADKIEIVEVPDITVEGAFDKAVEGVDAIAHLAAPVSQYFKDPAPVMHAAVNGITQLLQSAYSEPSVKSFVFMSSILAILTSQRPHRFTEKDWNNESQEIVAAKGKDAPSLTIYAASKTAAERAFWKFRDDKKPHFTMTTVNPTYVGGPPLVLPPSPDQLGQTVEFVWHVFSGRPFDKCGVPGAFYAYVDVRDVARLVVFGIEHPEKADSERYIAANVFAPLQATADILRAAYPERKHIIQEGNPGEGYFPDYRFPDEVIFDGSKAVRATGQGYIPWETTVQDAAKAFEKYL
ncbi:hypothetical protein GGI35DRAFT_472665 [Trichoderma velutinum]